MSDTFNTKNFGKRKRTGKTDFISEKTMDRKCGSIDDKLEKMMIEEKVRKQVEAQFLKEIEELTKQQNKPIARPGGGKVDAREKQNKAESLLFWKQNS